MKTNIEYYGVPLTVDYTLAGKSLPATHYDPAEEPEIIIIAITAEDSDIDLQNMLSWEQIEDIIDLIEI